MSIKFRIDVALETFSRSKKTLILSWDLVNTISKIRRIPEFWNRYNSAGNWATEISREPFLEIFQRPKKWRWIYSDSSISLREKGEKKKHTKIWFFFFILQTKIRIFNSVFRNPYKKKQNGLRITPLKNFQDSNEPANLTVRKSSREVHQPSKHFGSPPYYLWAAAA